MDNEYGVVVVASGGQLQATKKVAVNVTDVYEPGVPRPPGGLSAESGWTLIHLEWLPAADVSHYDVQMQRKANAPPYPGKWPTDWTLLVENEATATEGIRHRYTHTGLDPDYIYRYRVRSRIGDIVSTWSDIIPDNDSGVQPRPGAPTQPEATAENGTATLTWTMPGSTGTLTKWEYLVGTVVGGEVVWGEWKHIGGPSARNGDAEGLTNGTAYTFQVRAFNDAGDGEPSPASETVIPRQSIGDLAITGAETPRLPEHSEDVVATYVATFPAGHSISWSLVDQYDDDAFSIDGGLLSFRAPPDFEAPIDTGDYTDANGNTDPNGNNVYHVTVRIDDAGSSGGFSIFDVTVTVTNVDEPGRVELSSTAPKVGDRLTAELTDPDMGIEVVEWHWQALPPGTRSTHPPTGPGESTDPSLLVTSEHIGLTLSAQVTYLDGESNNANDRKSAQSAATAPVVDVPSAPRNLEAAAGNARVDLRWDPPLTDNGSALTGYVVSATAATASELDPGDSGG